MMSIRAKITLILVFVAVVFIGLQALRIKSLTGERDRYRSNSTALLGEVERYRTQDSLNVAKAGVLTLKIAELERYRAEDAALLKSLQIRKNELEQITKAQTRMIADLHGTVADTVVVVREVVDSSALSLNVHDAWIDLHGIVYDGGFDGTLEVRDSLVVVESVVRARFLGFLWRTKRIKARSVEVVSRNPYTEIMGVESISIDR
jgi:hypothetical protein